MFNLFGKLDDQNFYIFEWQTFDYNEPTMQELNDGEYLILYILKHLAKTLIAHSQYGAIISYFDAGTNIFIFLRAGYTD